jgi:hypothetical protein
MFQVKTFSYIDSLGIETNSFAVVLEGHLFDKRVINYVLDEVEHSGGR